MIYTAMVGTDDGLLKMDVIAHEGEFWLVPYWLDNKAQGWSMPERIIRLLLLPHQKTLGGPMADFVVNISIPKAVLDGGDPREAGIQFQVLERPDIRLPFVHH